MYEISSHVIWDEQTRKRHENCNFLSQRDAEETLNFLLIIGNKSQLALSNYPKREFMNGSSLHFMRIEAILSPKSDI